MMKIKGSLVAKLAAIFLLIAMMLVFCGSAVGVAMMVEFGGYSGRYDPAEAVRGIGVNYLHSTASYYYDLIGMIDRGETVEAEEFELYVDEAFRCTLFDETGRVLYDNLDGADINWSGTWVMDYHYDREPDGSLSHHWSGYFQDGLYNFKETGDAIAVPETEPVDTTPTPQPVRTSRSTVAVAESSPIPEEPEEVLLGSEEPEEQEEAHRYVLQGYILAEPQKGTSAYTMLNLFNWCYGFRYQLIGIAAASLLLGIILFIFLMCAAGHRDGTDAVTANFVDKIPSDLFAAAVAAAAMVPLIGGFDIMRWNSEEPFIFVFGACLMLIPSAILAILFCMSFATRLKLGTVIKNSVCYMVLVWCWRIVLAILRWCRRVLRGTVRMAGKLFHSIPMLRRAILIMAALLFVEFFWMAIFQYEFGALVFGWFVERTALVLAVLYGLLCLRRLQKGAKEIARGHVDYVVDTRYMRGDFKDAAEDLNSIRDGLTKAVNERMKSEHFKTELITNVSHDIKTPLTSIVNYVDLLGKEEPENEQMREYIEVLSRQSARLKKLIDDLIEASKASTGNLSVNYERCELGVLLDQTVGEYAEKLAAADLELVIKKPEEPVTVMADGRHTWRIFDNLMNNICKYAQPGTRVYLNLEKTGGKAVVTFRNISRSQLNISGDELMERFVRGDSSRNTEGSGLGLSIARSLAQLQRSDLELTVDGDLFKVTLSFDAVL